MMRLCRKVLFAENIFSGYYLRMDYDTASIRKQKSLCYQEEKQTLQSRQKSCEAIYQNACLSLTFFVLFRLTYVFSDGIIVLMRSKVLLLLEILLLSYFLHSHGFSSLPLLIQPTLVRLFKMMSSSFLLSLYTHLNCISFFCAENSMYIQSSSNLVYVCLL